MTTSSAPEPPILAETAKARNCLGLNATVLPGLGTFRHGARLRGVVEMAVTLVGTLWFCQALFRIAGEVMEGTGFLAAVGMQAWTLLLSAIVVVGSWISGVNFGRAAVRREMRGQIKIKTRIERAPSS